MPETRTGDDLDTVTKISGRSVSDTVARLTELVAAKGMRLFAVIDQAAEARKAGLQLRETTMVIFGSPVAGTPVMVAEPLAALDLPLKVLVGVDEQREARPGFTCSGWRPQPDKFRTPDEFRNGNLACWSAVSERSADGRRTDNGR